MNYEQSNVGLGMVPHKANCSCDECRCERLAAENAILKARLVEARDARDLAEGKLIAYERMAERVHAYCRELSEAENVRLTGYEPWEAWRELDGALAELRADIADREEVDRG